MPFAESIKRKQDGSPWLKVLGYYGAPHRHEHPSGDIWNLNIRGNVSVIYCHAGSRRSSHWHKTDAHYLFVVSGRMEYWERPVGSERPPKRKVYKQGKQAFTDSNMEHWTEFPVDTVLVSVSKLHRTHEAHEQDVVRVPWFE